MKQRPTAGAVFDRRMWPLGRPPVGRMTGKRNCKRCRWELLPGEDEICNICRDEQIALAARQERLRASLVRKLAKGARGR